MAHLGLCVYAQLLSGNVTNMDYNCNKRRDVSAGASNRKLSYKQELEPLEIFGYVG